MVQKLKGQVAANNGNHGHGAKNEAVELLAQTGVNLVGMVTAAVLFATVFGIAVGLGFGLHWAQVHFTWMPAWMFAVGHAAEAVLFVADIAGLLWGVGKHLMMQLKLE